MEDVVGESSYLVAGVNRDACLSRQARTMHRIQLPLVGVPIREAIKPPGFTEVEYSAKANIQTSLPAEKCIALATNSLPFSAARFKHSYR